MNESTKAQPRYARQVIFPGIGEAGQARLASARVVLMGCGATGTVIANHLVRAGVGTLHLIDRDFIELNNLQRQLLFDEADLAANLPKAIAAERKLRAINSQVEVHGHVADLNPETIEDLLFEADLIMDGTDNFEVRYLINDVAVKHNLPWIYTAAVGGHGVSQTIIPGQTPCLRCLMPEMPPPGSTPTCDTAGVVGPVVGAVASFSATEALKLLVGQGQPNPGLLQWDVWHAQAETINLGPPRSDCPTCARHEFPFLTAELGPLTSSLCGREAIQIRPKHAPHTKNRLDLAEMARKLAEVSQLNAQNDFLLRFKLESGPEITLFADGRAIIKGSTNETAARALYARYVGT